MDSVENLLERVKTADLVDAMGRLHRHRCHIQDLVSPTPGSVLFGRAVTVSYFPTCNHALDPDRFNFGRLFYEAVGEDPEGKVLVLASNGHPEVSLGGGTKMSRVHNAGMAGILADGRLRDFDELARYDFTVYSTGEATRWGGDVVTPFQANVPVVVSGVGILPGSFIYADSSGAVVIPEGQFEEVLEEAARIEEQDARSIQEIQGEDAEKVAADGSDER